MKPNKLVQTQRNAKLRILAGSLMLFLGCSPAGNKGTTGAPVKPKIAESIVEISMEPVQVQLDNALQKKQVVFLILTSGDLSANNKAMAMAQQAQQQTTAGSVIVTMDRTDSTNRAIAGKWSLYGISVPAVVVISPKGVPVIGYPIEEATAERLSAAVPTAKMDEAFYALQENKSVFLVITSGNSIEEKKLLALCQAAGAQLSSGAVVIEVEQTDTTERPLLDNFEINTSSADPKIVVLNKNGDKTGVLQRPVTIQQLVSAANKVVNNPCCANGSSCN